MANRHFRFGVVAAQAQSGQDWLDKARRVEALGYDTLVMPDTVAYSLSPLPALAAVATATSRLRLGTYVIANDFRNPALLAKEAATVDFLSGGRFELGLGAGRPSAASDNAMLGIPFEPGNVRVERLSESVRIIKALLSGERASAAGPHYGVANAMIAPQPVQQPHPPILIAGSGKRMLALAAREADIVALGVPPTATEQDVAEKIGWLRAAVGERFDQLEINVNLMAVGGQLPRYLSAQLGLVDCQV